VIPNTEISLTLERRRYQFLLLHKNREQKFSLMKLKKSDLSVRMTYEYLAAVLRSATSIFMENIGKFISNILHITFVITYNESYN
jgi:hypothetical protein